MEDKLLNNFQVALKNYLEKREEMYGLMESNSPLNYTEAGEGFCENLCWDERDAYAKLEKALKELRPI